MKNLTELKKRLSENTKEAESLKGEIKALEEANRPKSIIERVNSFKDVLDIAKPSKDCLNILNYNSDDEGMIFSRDYLKLFYISKVLNEGCKLQMSDDRYFAWFDTKKSAFVFSYAGYGWASSNTGVGSRLCFKNSEICTHAAKIFTEEYKVAIIG